MGEHDITSWWFRWECTCGTRGRAWTPRLAAFAAIDHVLDAREEAPGEWLRGEH